MVVYSRGARLTTPRARGSHPPRPRTLLPHRHPTSPSNTPLSLAQQRTLAHTHELRRPLTPTQSGETWAQSVAPFKAPTRSLTTSSPTLLPPCAGRRELPYAESLVGVSTVGMFFLLPDAHARCQTLCSLAHSVDAVCVSTLPSPCAALPGDREAKAGPSRSRLARACTG